MLLDRLLHGTNGKYPLLLSTTLIVKNITSRFLVSCQRPIASVQKDFETFPPTQALPT